MKSAWTDRIFYSLLVALLLLSMNLAYKYNVQLDLSNNNSNSLHEESIKLLNKLHGPLALTAFMADLPVQRGAVTELVAKYKRLYPQVTLNFIDPSAHPEQSRQLGIEHSGEMLVEYNNKTEKISQINEQALSNAIARLSLSEEGWIVSLQGHGEADLFGLANFDLAEFNRLLQDKGYRTINLELQATGQVPTNTSFLMVAAPRNEISDKELEIILDYIRKGGNLLWLTEKALPAQFAELLGISTRPGTVVDAAAADLGIDTPGIAVASNHPQHDISDQLDGPVLLPMAVALTAGQSNIDWETTPLLATGARSWNETGALKGQISRDNTMGEVIGPLNMALAMTRPVKEREQRVIIVGDADFLSNAYLGNGQNQRFGLAMAHWLAANEHLVAIPPRPVQDQAFHWQPLTMALVTSTLLILLPLLLLLGGFITYYRRKRQ